LTFTKALLITTIPNLSSFPAGKQSIKISGKHFRKQMSVLTFAGRERLCKAKLEKLDEVHKWVGQYRQLWTGRLNALRNFIEQDKPQAKRITKKKQGRSNLKSKK